MLCFSATYPSHRRGLCFHGERRSANAGCYVFSDDRDRAHEVHHKRTLQQRLPTRLQSGSSTLHERTRSAQPKSRHRRQPVHKYSTHSRRSRHRQSRHQRPPMTTTFEAHIQKHPEAEPQLEHATYLSLTNQLKLTSQTFTITGTSGGKPIALTLPPISFQFHTTVPGHYFSHGSTSFTHFDLLQTGVERQEPPTNQCSGA